MQASLERLRQRREEGREGGFTLIELLIVIVILAILAAIVVFAVQNLTKQSATAACNSDYKTVETAAETFKAQTGAYPGGTYNNGATVSAITAPTGDNLTGVPTGDLYLMQTTDTSDGTTVIGPWLKDLPYNNGHYQVALSDDGKGTIAVYTTDAAPAVIATGCAGVS